jgi:hypothetical protein
LIIPASLDKSVHDHPGHGVAQSLRPQTSIRDADYYRP